MNNLDITNMNETTPYQQGLVLDLTSQIDWEVVLAQPRYSGGHEDVMKNIFGPKAVVTGWWSENDYSGQVAVALTFEDGKTVVMTDYYGSCSGCDAWEDSSEEDARKMILDLVNDSYVFLSLEAAKAWCKSIDASQNPWEYPKCAARNLF